MTPASTTTVTAPATHTNDGWRNTFQTRGQITDGFLFRLAFPALFADSRSGKSGIVTKRGGATGSGSGATVRAGPESGSGAGFLVGAVAMGIDGPVGVDGQTIEPLAGHPSRRPPVSRRSGGSPPPMPGIRAIRAAAVSNHRAAAETFVSVPL